MPSTARGSAVAKAGIGKAASDEYRGDYYGWLTATAQTIEDRRELADADLAQIAEELRDMSKSERRAIESHLERIMVHLLEIRFQPGKQTRSWELSIADSRVRARKLFHDSPSLARRKRELMLDAYDTARIGAARQTGIDLDALPPACPFTVDEVLGAGK